MVLTRGISPAAESPADVESAAGPPAFEEAIPSAVKRLAPPEARPVAGFPVFAVSGADETVQQQVLAGLSHVHGGWDFEASCHFAAAIRKDPECLLAHWGMALALLEPAPETDPAMAAAVERMAWLAAKGKGTELEVRYTTALLRHLREGPAAGAREFAEIVSAFPNESQAVLFAPLFSRGGYTETGEATPDQRAAEASLEAQVRKHPESPLPFNALLMAAAEAPDLSPRLEAARSLCAKVPDYAPYRHLLGHYEWRCGNHREAEASFAAAAAGYREWMTTRKADLADCPGWLRAECYRAVALASRGKTEEALQVARAAAAAEIDPKRTLSAGFRFQLWEAKTLPARILLRRGTKGDAAAALATLPTPEQLAPLRKESLAYWWIDGLRILLESRRLLEDGKPEEARAVMRALTDHGERFAATRPMAVRGGEGSFWSRSFQSLEILSSELRGDIALAGPPELHGAAATWFTTAAERQTPAPLLLPPLALKPVAARLAEFHLSRRAPREALEAARRAIAAFPSDPFALATLEQAQRAAGDAAAADATRRRIVEITAP
jgi:tetratricopeptide (TPR) repeat protein